MNIEKMYPWNWFKHEESQRQNAQIPVSYKESLNRSNYSADMSHHPVAQLHNQIDRMFDDVCSHFGMPGLRRSEPLDSFFNWPSVSGYRASVDISGDNESYEVSIDVPGMNESDLSIHLEGNTLRVSGKKSEHSESKDKHYYRTERSYGAFERTLSLPEDANVDEIKASLNNGVLSLLIPRKIVEGKEVKKISINE